MESENTIEKNVAVCKACGKPSVELGLNPRGYHSTCEPCVKCKKVISGCGVNQYGLHMHCDGNDPYVIDDKYFLTEL